MNITEKKLENATVELQIDVPIEKVEIEYKAVFDKIRRSVKIDGFRKGKAPLHIVETMYKEYADRDVAENLIKSVFIEAVKKRDLVPIIEPKYDFNKINRDEPFSFKATFEVLPTVELGKYTGIPATKRACDIKDSDVTSEIDSITERHAKFTQKDDSEALQNNDFVKLEMKRIDDIDESRIDSIEFKEYSFIVGKSKNDYTLDSHIVGMKKDEEREVEIKYPKKYSVPDLSGQKATYLVKITEINKMDLPELDDEFVKKIEFESVDDMKRKIRENLEKYVNERTIGETRSQIINEIINASKFDLPESMIKDEMQNRFQKTQERIGYQAEDIDQFATSLGIEPDKFKEKLREDAQQAIQTSLILSKVTKEENLKVSDEKYKEFVEKIAKEHNKSVEEIETMISENNSRQNIENELILDVSMDFLYENAKIKKLKPVSLEELTKG